jgi:hypothetical protein
MKKVFLYFSIILFFACSKDYVMTEFYVKNTSDKIINFEASVMKSSQILGPHEVTEFFTVHPNDSVLARKIEFLADNTKWFTSFKIYQVEGIQMNDPNLPENWIKYNRNNLPIYVFTLNKN